MFNSVCGRGRRKGNKKPLWIDEKIAGQEEACREKRFRDYMVGMPRKRLGERLESSVMPWLMERSQTGR